MKKMKLKIGDLEPQIPVIQGGMGVGVSLSKLAGSVAKEGGIGILSTAQIGYEYDGFDQNPIETNLRAIKEEVKKARKIADGGIIGVNIMVATRDYERYVEAAVEAGVDLIISGAGLPMTLPKLTKGSNVKLVPIVSSVKSADVILKYWDKKYNRLPDAIVIEGPKAGGHLGFKLEEAQNMTSEEFDKIIVDIIACVNGFGQEKGKDISVVIAGGIYERADLEHAYELGAKGVQMATRFVTTYECDADMAYKQAYINAKKEDITIVKSPVGMPGRAIRNSFVEKTLRGNIPHGKCHLCISTCKPNETPYCITDALVNAVKGNVDDALLFCGENAYKATKLETVADIMREFA